MGTGALGHFHTALAKSGRAALCLSNQLINAAQDTAAGTVSFQLCSRQCQAAQTGTPMQRHPWTRDTAAGSHPQGWSGNALLWTEPPCETASAQDCSTLFFTFYPWQGSSDPSYSNSSPTDCNAGNARAHRNGEMQPFFLSKQPWINILCGQNPSPSFL